MTTLTLDTGGPVPAEHLDRQLDAALAVAFPAAADGSLQIDSAWTAYLYDLRGHWIDLVHRFFAPSPRHFTLHIVITAVPPPHTPPESIAVTITTAAAQGATAPTGSLA